MVRIGGGVAVVLVLTLAACSPSEPPQAGAPAAESAPTATVIPDLVGLQGPGVVPVLQASGLALGPTSYAPSDQPAETVIAQYPAAGSPFQPGDEVQVILSSGPPPPEPQPVAPPPAAEPSADSALAVLGTLRVAGRGPKTGYERARFGQAWFDVDRNGCDTRNDILTRDLTAITYRSAASCAVTTGTLDDPFTATTIRFVRGGPSEVDVDHVVSLGNAWVTGGARMSYSKRVAFANDPLNLLAVDASANRQKADGDAATWLPSNKSFRCAYVARQVGVKAKFGLYVTAPEKPAIEQVLADCPNQKVPTGGGPTDSGLREPTTNAPKPSSGNAGSGGSSGGTTDADYGTCAAAKAAGKGPYVSGRDPEYDFYTDGDSDGIVCE